jgi:hypothetical protein
LPGGTEKNHQISVKVSSHQAEIWHQAIQNTKQEWQALTCKIL